MRAYNGDLAARLRWLSEHDRAALVELLADVAPAVLGEAQRRAGRGVRPEHPRPAYDSRR